MTLFSSCYLFLIKCCKDKKNISELIMYLCALNNQVYIESFSKLPLSACVRQFFTT